MQNRTGAHLCFNSFQNGKTQLAFYPLVSIPPEPYPLGPYPSLLERQKQAIRIPLECFLVLVAFIRSIWLFCPTILPVIGAERMCYENVIISKFHSFSWNERTSKIKKKWPDVIQHGLLRALDCALENMSELRNEYLCGSDRKHHLRVYRVVCLVKQQAHTEDRDTTVKVSCSRLGTQE